MKNKKGFTLVELLAVMVIISILLSLAIPNISKYVLDSRKKAFVEDARTVVSSTRSHYLSGKYELSSDITITKDKVTYSMEAIQDTLSKKLGVGPFNEKYKDAGVVIKKSIGGYGEDIYEYYICLIDEGGNGFDYTKNEDISTDNTIADGSLTNCGNLPVSKYTVQVTTFNGKLADGEEAKKIVNEGADTSFNLVPDSAELDAVVKCSNNQRGVINNNVLSVTNVTHNTTCSVLFDKGITVLYGDGTLIINEKLSDRDSNISKHSSVVKEYPALSNSYAYIFSYSLDENEKYQVNYPWADNFDKIKSVEIGQIVKPTNTAFWFYGLINMTKGNFENLDTSNVTDMRYMFAYTATSQMENGATPMFTSLERKDSDYKLVGLDGWNTSNVTDMSFMFEYAGYDALDTWSIGNLSNWDTSNVTNMKHMFACAGFNIGGSMYGLVPQSNIVDDIIPLASVSEYERTFELIGLGSWNVSNVTNMESMFFSAGYKAQKCILGDLSHWRPLKVVDFSYMFDYAGSDSTVWNLGDLKDWRTPKATNMSYMFASSGGDAQTWTIGSLNDWDTSSVTNMQGMFLSTGSSALSWNMGTKLNWDTSKVEDMSYMFDYIAPHSAGVKIDISDWNVSSVKDMSYMFSNSWPNAINYKFDLSNWRTNSLENMYRMFSSAGRNSTTFDVDLSNFNTSKVTNMAYLFSSTASTNNSNNNSRSWSVGDLSNWDTSKVTNMDSMFNHAGYLAPTWKSIGSLDIHTVNMYAMFSNVVNVKATLNIYSNPPASEKPFINNAARGDDARIVLNYSSATTNINAIYNTRGSGTHIELGQQLD